MVERSGTPDAVSTWKSGTWSPGSRYISLNVNIDGGNGVAMVSDKTADISKKGGMWAGTYRH